MYPLTESDLDGHDRSDPKRASLERRMLGGDSLRGGLSGRGATTAPGRENPESVLIMRQEVNAPSPELEPLPPPERGPAAVSALPAHTPCGRARHGVFCRKPRGHSGRCDL